MSILITCPTHLDLNCGFYPILVSFAQVDHGMSTWVLLTQPATIWNESAPIQLEQCWFPGLVIFSAKYKYSF